MSSITPVTGPQATGLPRLHGWAAAPGVWAIPVPFPSPLGYSICYATRVEGGVILVDLGWDSDDAWEALQRGFERAGASLKEVVGVVCTHLHPDHYGLAGRLKAHTSAWIACHPAERPQVAPSSAARAIRVSEIVVWLDLCGVPRSLQSEIEREAVERLALPSVLPDLDLIDHSPIPGSKNRLLAWHTPGHTPGHLCVADREQGLLLTGDHLLPRVTPNVSKRPRNGLDPLNDYLLSLDVVDRIAPRLVLPGHEWPFDRPSIRTQILRRHHRHRLIEIAEAVGQGAETVWDVAQTVAWSRPFDTFDSRAQRQALGETHSHLQKLAANGQVDVVIGTPERWFAGDPRGMDRPKKRPEA